MPIHLILQVDIYLPKGMVRIHIRVGNGKNRVEIADNRVKFGGLPVILARFRSY